MILNMFVGFENLRVLLYITEGGAGAGMAAAL